MGQNVGKPGRDYKPGDGEPPAGRFRSRPRRRLVGRASSEGTNRPYPAAVQAARTRWPGFPSLPKEVVCHPLAWRHVPA